jgi:hypothetical protein
MKFNFVFGSKNKKIEPIEEQVKQYQPIVDEHEQILINKVIDMLQTQPEKFSARWSGYHQTLDKSVQCGNVLIMIETGQIALPVEVKMTKEQKKIIVELIKPIAKRDSDYVIDLLMK